MARSGRWRRRSPAMRRRGSPASPDQDGEAQPRRDRDRRQREAVDGGRGGRRRGGARARPGRRPGRAGHAARAARGGRRLGRRNRRGRRPATAPPGYAPPPQQPYGQPASRRPAAMSRPARCRRRARRSTPIYKNKIAIGAAVGGRALARLYLYSQRNAVAEIRTGRAERAARPAGRRTRRAAPGPQSGQQGPQARTQSGGQQGAAGQYPDARQQRRPAESCRSTGCRTGSAIPFLIQTRGGPAPGGVILPPNGWDQGPATVVFGARRRHDRPGPDRQSGHRPDAARPGPERRRPARRRCNGSRTGSAWARSASPSVGRRPEPKRRCRPVRHDDVRAWTRPASSRRGVRPDADDERAQAFDRLAAALAEIRPRFGAGGFSDRRRVIGLLADKAPDAKREIRVVGTAIDEGIPASLARTERHLVGVEMDRLANGLEASTGLRLDIARQVVRAFAFAMDLGPAALDLRSGGGRRRRSRRRPRRSRPPTGGWTGHDRAGPAPAAADGQRPDLAISADLAADPALSDRAAPRRWASRACRPKKPNMAGRIALGVGGLVVLALGVSQFMGGARPAPGPVRPTMSSSPARPASPASWSTRASPPQSELNANLGSPTPLSIAVGAAGDDDRAAADDPERSAAHPRRRPRPAARADHPGLLLAAVRRLGRLVPGQLSERFRGRAQPGHRRRARPARSCSSAPARIAGNPTMRRCAPTPPAIRGCSGIAAGSRPGPRRGCRWRRCRPRARRSRSADPAATAAGRSAAAAGRSQQLRRSSPIRTRPTGDKVPTRSAARAGRSSARPGSRGRR